MFFTELLRFSYFMFVPTEYQKLVDNRILQTKLIADIGSSYQVLLDQVNVSADAKLLIRFLGKSIN